MDGKKEKIGIDIDEVVVEFFKEYLVLFNERFGKNLKFEDLYKYHIWDLTDVSKWDSLNLVNEFYESERFDNLNLVEGFKEALMDLKDNFEIHFITSRPESIKEKTKFFLDKLFEDFVFGLHFSGGVWGESKTKGEIARELELGFFVEDHADYALDCARKGIKTFLLDKPWNKDCEEHENIVRVNNWSEILVKLNGGGRNIVEEVRKFVEEECNKPTSKYGRAPYEFHFIPMVHLAKQLALKKNADLEIVELAGWLHDIGSIIYGRKDHHITGAEIAEKKLKEFDYPLERIERVKNCILTHRGSNDLQPETPEAETIMEADAMSNFDNLTGIFMAAFIYENNNQGEAKVSVREKLIRKWNQLSPEGKELIKDKYDAAMLLLK